MNSPKRNTVLAAIAAIAVGALALPRPPVRAAEMLLDPGAEQYLDLSPEQAQKLRAMDRDLSVELDRLERRRHDLLREFGQALVQVDRTNEEQLDQLVGAMAQLAAQQTLARRTCQIVIARNLSPEQRERFRQWLERSEQQRRAIETLGRAPQARPGSRWVPARPSDPPPRGTPERPAPGNVAPSDHHPLGAVQVFPPPLSPNQTQAPQSKKGPQDEAP